jgi:hypothetical protein
MPLLTREVLYQYRSRTFHWQPRLRLHFERDAIRFVNERGFIFFWPVKDVLLPSLWEAVAGDRPVPNNHDDPAHITWRWKDRLLGKRKWYYARILKKRNTIISLRELPFFYALSPNFGDPENDYRIQYEQGLLPMEAKSVYEALLREGALDTLALKKAANLASPANASRFIRALDILQCDFRIMPVGIAEAGTWNYAFIYDTFHRHFPEIIDTAEKIDLAEARGHLLKTYLFSVGASPIDQPKRLFKWRERDFEQAIARCEGQNEFSRGIFFKDVNREWLALDTLLI